MKFQRGRKQKNWFKVFLVYTLMFLMITITAAMLVRREYNRNLRPLSGSQKSVTFEIEQGSTVKQVGDKLEQQKLIRAAWAFEWYFRTHNLRDSLKAGTYSLRPDMAIKEIADIVTDGKVATDQITILPGKRLDEVRSMLINNGFSVSEVDNALSPKNYLGHPALVDKPEEASLEGYLFPETFQKIATTRPETIIKLSLDELQNKKLLSPSMRTNFTRHGLTVYEAITLASIIEKEAGAEAEKPKIAQVFLRRLQEGMKLQSDATASYGAVLSGDFDSLSDEELLHFESAYNTYLHEGLPPGPISNFTASSLEAVAKPASTDFLYFVSGKDCVTRFSKTNEEHEELQKKHGIRGFNTVCK